MLSRWVWVVLVVLSAGCGANNSVEEPTNPTPPPPPGATQSLDGSDAPTTGSPGSAY